MSSEQRAIVLTNDNPNITYTGEWTTINASMFSDSGTWGAAFSPTLHITKTDGSFSFPFHGSSAFVFGTVNVANLTTDPDPNWECFVDGISLGSSNFESPMQNNWELCGVENFSDGPHELTVNITSRGMPFYLDTLQYRASPGVSLENNLIAIYPGDPAIAYGSGWHFGFLAGNETSEPNSIVNLAFIGVQLSWYGFIAPGPHNTSSGEWSIDGGSSQSFQVTNSIPDTSNTGANQLFFMTPILDMGSHELSVKYTGTPEQNPLTLDYFIVKNSSFSTSPTSSSPTVSGGANGTGPHTAIPSSNQVSPVGAKKDSSTTKINIISGVVGSIIAVAIISFLVWFKIYRKRNRRPPPTITPFHPAILAPQSPLQTNKQNNHIDITQSQNTRTMTMVPTESLKPNPMSTASRHTNNPSFPETQDSPSPEMTGRSSSGNPSFSVTPVHASNTASRESRILIQHEDSGTRISPYVVVEETEIPPMYTED